MGDKRVNIISLRLDDGELEALKQKAGSGKPSDFLRGLLSLPIQDQTKKEPEPSPAKQEAEHNLSVHHIDDLGEDPLRADNGALPR